MIFFPNFIYASSDIAFRLLKTNEITVNATSFPGQSARRGGKWKHQRWWQVNMHGNYLKPHPVVVICTRSYRNSPNKRTSAWKKEATYATRNLLLLLWTVYARLLIKRIHCCLQYTKNASGRLLFVLSRSKAFISIETTRTILAPRSPHYTSEQNSTFSSNNYILLIASIP